MSGSGLYSNEESSALRSIQSPVRLGGEGGNGGVKAADPLLAAAQQEINNSRALRAQTVVSSFGFQSSPSRINAAKRAPSPPMTSPIRAASPQIRSPATGAAALRQSTDRHVQQTVAPRRPDYFPATGHESTILEETIMHAQQLQQKVAHLERLLVAEEKNGCDLRAQLQHETRLAAGSKARVDELTQLLDKSNLMGEENDGKYRSARSQLELVVAELQSSIADMSKLRDANTELHQQLEATTRGKEDAMREAKTVSQERDELSLQLSQARRERDDHRRTVEELRNDVQSMGKKHEAATQLAHARATGLQAEMQHQMDALTSQVAELQSTLSRTEAELQLLRTESSATIKRNEDHLEAAETIIANLRRELQHERDVNVQRISNYQQRETEQQAELQDLKLRVDDVHRQRDALSKELLERSNQIEHLNDVNHVLAVRLKAAGADKEAHEMEVEARRVLTKQNSDMERQLVELRRTIQMLMASRPSSSSSSPSFR